MYKKILLIGSGFLNLIHAGTHLIQFIQSVFLISYTQEHHHHDDWLHNPFLSILWAIIGLITLYVGIKDYIHHRRCNHND
jgi:hypothetical protein